MNHHEAAAAEVATARIGDGLGVTHCHRGIYGVASLFEDLDAHVRCQMLRGDHHAVSRFQRWFGCGRGGTGGEQGEK